MVETAEDTTLNENSFFLCVYCFGMRGEWHFSNIFFKINRYLDILVVKEGLSEKKVV